MNSEFEVILTPERLLLIDLSRKYPETIKIITESCWISCYQAHIVEQWVPNRDKLLKTVTVYTGDKKHLLLVTAFGIKKSCMDSVPEIQKMFKQWEMDKSKEMQTERGKLYITNLSTFSSYLNLIHVLDGDFCQHYNIFLINLNLRRLGCSGRSALTLQPPSSAHKDRFFQLFKISETAEFPAVVFEMIKLVQQCLYYLSYQPKAYIDGILCDETYEALKKFMDQYHLTDLTVNKEANCDSKLVSLVLSKVFTLRNKLNALGFQCSKNIFQESEMFTSSILQFQKQNKLEQTGILDWVTVEKLNDVYLRTSPPMLKSKVFKSKKEEETLHHHLDIETSDLDELKSHVHMEPFRLIWGKSKQKTTGGDVLLESAQLAEGLLQGGKEFGKSLLRGVSNKTQRIPELRDRVKVMKGLREGVAGGISKISSSVEGFVDRRRISKMKSMPVSKMKSDRSFNRQSLSDEEEDELTTSAVDDLRLKKRFYSMSRMHLEEPGLQLEMEIKQRITRANSQPNAFSDCLENEDLSKELELLKQQEMEAVMILDGLKEVAKSYAERIQNLAEMYAENWSGFSSIETLLNQLIEKFKVVTNEIETVQANISRIHYEISGLEEKMKEFMEITDQFMVKMDELDEQIEAGLAYMENYDFFKWIKSWFLRS